MPRLRLRSNLSRASWPLSSLNLWPESPARAAASRKEFQEFFSALWYILHRVWRGLLTLAERPASRLLSLGWRCSKLVHPPYSTARTVKVGVFVVGMKCAVALCAANAPYSLFFAEDGPQTPFPFNATYFAGSLAIFVRLTFLGFATWRTEVLLPHWKILPLAVGLSALMPVWVLVLIHLELPVVLLGFGWMLLGYVLWSVGRDPVWRTAPVR